MRAGFTSLAAAAVLILADVAIFVNITRPVARRIETTERTLRTLFESMNEDVARTEFSAMPPGNP